MDPLDRDYLIRTLFGEASSDPASQAAVAHVIQNRAKKTGASVKDVVTSPWQFEPWMTRKKELEALDPLSPEYTALGKVADDVISGKTPDPTGGATLFYSPTAQAAAGRPAPKWATGTGLDIGQHRFYGGDFPTPVTGAEPPKATADARIGAKASAEAIAKPIQEADEGTVNPAVIMALFDRKKNDPAFVNLLRRQGYSEDQIKFITGG